MGRHAAPLPHGKLGRSLPFLYGDRATLTFAPSPIGKDRPPPVRSPGAASGGQRGMRPGRIVRILSAGRRKEPSGLVAMLDPERSLQRVVSFWRSPIQAGRGLISLPRPWLPSWGQAVHGRKSRESGLQGTVGLWGEGSWDLLVLER